MRLRIVAAAVTALLAGCGGTVDCGPCGYPVTVGLDSLRGDREVSGTACVEGWGCQPFEGTAGSSFGFEPPDGQGASHAEDRTVTVTVQPSRPGGTPWTGEATFRFADETGECACPTSHAQVALVRD